MPLETNPGGNNSDINNPWAGLKNAESSLTEGQTGLAINSASKVSPKTLAPVIQQLIGWRNELPDAPRQQAAFTIEIGTAPRLEFRQDNLADPLRETVTSCLKERFPGDSISVRVYVITDTCYPDGRVGVRLDVTFYQPKTTL